MNTYLRTMMIFTMIPVITIMTACTSRVESQFMERCRVGGVDKAMCSCIYGKVKDHYPAEWVKHFGENGWLPADINQVSQQAAQQCGVK